VTAHEQRDGRDHPGHSSALLADSERHAEMAERPHDQQPEPRRAATDRSVRMLHGDGNLSRISVSNRICPVTAAAISSNIAVRPSNVTSILSRRSVTERQVVLRLLHLQPPLQRRDLVLQLVANLALLLRERRHLLRVTKLRRHKLVAAFFRSAVRIFTCSPRSSANSFQNDFKLFRKVNTPAATTTTAAVMIDPSPIVFEKLTDASHDAPIPARRGCPSGASGSGSARRPQVSFSAGRSGWCAAPAARPLHDAAGS
jgi:hypothetical protein